LVACVIIPVGQVTIRRQRAVTDMLGRERDGTLALALAFPSCETASPSLLDTTADRFGLTSDDNVALRLHLDSVISSWPAGCARLQAAMRHLLRARGTNRAAFAERVAAIADETAAQTALVAGAEDALHGSQASQVPDPLAAPKTSAVARSVAAFVRAANSGRTKELESRYRATIQATNEAARWTFGTMEAGFDRRIAHAHVAERSTIWSAVGVFFAIGLVFAAMCYAFDRRRKARLSEAHERVERLRAEYARQEAVRALAVSETQFRALFDGSTIGVALLDRNGETVKANLALRHMIPELDPSTLGVNHPAFALLWDGTRDTIAFEIERGSEAEHHWFDVNLSVIRSEDGTPASVMSLVRDITDRKLADQLLVHQATHDSLTGLPNRAFFFDRLRDHVIGGVQGGNASAVFFVDLDDFKSVNDAIGHESGDAVLVAASRRLRAELAGQFVARLGGDEFGVLVERCEGREQIERMARMLVASFLPPLTVEGREVFVTATVGVAFREGDSLETASMLVRDADIAMYHAKRSGRSRYALFNDKMRESVVRRSILVSEMRKALEQGDFIVAFQPIVRLVDRSLLRYEALARWHHPQLGIIVPNEFIPIAEQTGMIHSLGELVLRRACERMRAWRTTLPALRVQLSVNVSVQQILSVGFDERAARLVRSFGLDTSDFMLEVTEGALLAAADPSTEALRRIKRAGFQLSIDDFGTGYSSLSYLQRFPFDELKIDMCFVTGHPSGLANEPIVAMVVALGESLGVRVVAEGVETEDQAMRLKALGCAGAQGYYFGAATLAPAFAASPEAATGT
jgi:diguanylate cyclase (GGDEF)-like protein